MILKRNMMDEDGQTHFSGERYVQQRSARDIPIDSEMNPRNNGGINTITTLNQNTPDDNKG